MFNEPAISRDEQAAVRVNQPPLSREQLLVNELRQLVTNVLAIEKETLPDLTEEPAPNGMPPVLLQNHLVATFEGRLLLDSEAAYDQLDALLTPLNYLAVFRPADPKLDETAGPHVIQIISGRINPAPRPWWPNLLLLIATLFSVLLVGTDLAIQEATRTNPLFPLLLNDNLFFELWRGLPYALSILLILGAHELGHYFAARRHKLAVTLPYFIPLPLISFFGTMGAFIQLRQPMRNKKMLLDVGAAGPLTGLVFAIPILLIGLSQAPLQPIATGGLYEGDSLLYAAAKTITYGRFVPDGRVDVCINCSQLAWAGWTGLLVTALNLIPIGQLDGGHVLYALIGNRARKLYFPLLAIMIALVFVTDVWLFWVILLLIFGRLYATPLDTITPLDNRRRGIAILALVVFALIFVPAPLSPAISSVPPANLTPGDSASLLPLLAPAAIVLFGRLRR
ncbi:MAG TPA: site-2 protease family protein [Phototrophicaceae bacterium]|nr:site-2 protease family protein [Phototrophicaceae bacterium]